jgi:hypothetical protein
MNGMLDPSLKGILRRLFAKIKHIINSILGKEIYLDNLFYKIYRGRLAYRPENKSTSNDNISKVVDENGESLDNNIYDSFKEDLLYYRYKKTDYSNLDNETKQYLEERHISEQEYQSLSASQREYLLHCM